MDRHCVSIGQPPLYSPVSAVGGSAAGPGVPGSPPGDIQQMGQGAAKAAGDIGGQLTQMANALGSMSNTLQGTMKWLFAPCTLGKYSTPTPCWFNGAVLLMMLWIISKIV